MAISLPALSEQLTPFKAAPRWLVAYSGGVDSQVLLHLLSRLTERPAITAVHINHQLQAGADRWEQACRQRASALGVAFCSETVQIESSGKQSLEEAARDARYDLFEAMLQPGELMFFGHHLDDQAETLLLRLLRGSGSRGLGAMPVSRSLGKGRLLRPLLQHSRADIEAYARQQALEWEEDPSNQSLNFDRNYLRHQVLPQIAERWPEFRSTFARAAALSEEAASLNMELAELDFHALSLSPQAQSLPIYALNDLSPGRLKNLLRFWLQSRQLALPSVAQMDALIKEVIGARQDAAPLLEWPGVQIRRFRDEVYAMQPLPPVAGIAVLPITPDNAIAVAGVGRISLEPDRGAGIGERWLRGSRVELRFRQGGERCQPQGRNNSQSLKKLMQEYEIETWIRDRVPMIYIDDTLAAVADYWVCEAYAAAADEPGYRCCWQRAF